MLQEDLRPEVPEKGWLELLSPRYHWIMLLTTLMPLFQQLSGINTCILYSSEVRFTLQTLSVLALLNTLTIK